jgi:3-oxosteroid 1-dehydrogenase
MCAMGAWDETVDLLVVGTGAAGMSAAIRAHDLGARVLLIEKTGQYGGSTAMSGGVCWVANNPWMAGRGVDDSDQDALSYLQEITGGEIPVDRLRTYVVESKRTVQYLHDHTWVRFDPLVHYTDYYPEAPGGRRGGRSMESRPFAGKRLGPELTALRRPHPQSQIMGKFGITAAEAHRALLPGWRTTLFLLWCFVTYLLRAPARRRWGRDTRLTCGNALVGRLRRSLLDREVPLWLHTSATALVLDGGRVVGAEIDRAGRRLRVRTRQGVLLAAGGFARNAQMRQHYQPAPITDKWSAANPADVGDGIGLGMEAGARIARMHDAWWTPTTLVPGSDLAWVLVVEKSLPHGMFVDRRGRRFTNEAAPYCDVVKSMYAADQNGAAIPAWMIFDATYRHRFPVGPIAPGYAMPDRSVPRRLRDGKFLHRADSLAELAHELGMDAAALEASVARFNHHARTGRDTDFGRGDSSADRYYGDPHVRPNPCLGAIERAPFYAIAVYPGDLGTKGGLATDLQGRVLSRDNTVIAGLYAAGNTTASVMGPTYPGAGGTIGPALTFGFVAAEAAHADAASAGRERAAWPEPTRTGQQPRPGPADGRPPGQATCGP